MWSGIDICAIKDFVSNGTVQSVDQLKEQYELHSNNFTFSTGLSFFLFFFYFLFYFHKIRVHRGGFCPFFGAQTLQDSELRQTDHLVLHVIFTMLCFLQGSA